MNKLIKKIIRGVSTTSYSQIFIAALITAVGIGAVTLQSGLYAKPAAKVPVCHLTGNGDYHLINISDNAYEAHLAIGDLPPGAPVPNKPGFTFGEDCSIAQTAPIINWVAYWDKLGTGNFDPIQDVPFAEVVTNPDKTQVMLVNSYLTNFGADPCSQTEPQQVVLDITLPILSSNDTIVIAGDDTQIAQLAINSQIGNNIATYYEYTNQQIVSAAKNITPTPSLMTNAEIDIGALTNPSIFTCTDKVNPPRWLVIQKLN